MKRLCLGLGTEPSRHASLSAWCLLLSSRCPGHPVPLLPGQLGSPLFLALEYLGVSPSADTIWLGSLGQHISNSLNLSSSVKLEKIFFFIFYFLNAASMLRSSWVLNHLSHPGPRGENLF